MLRIATLLSLTALGVSALVAAGCGDDDDGGGVTAKQLEDRTFVSTSVTGHTLAPGTAIVLAFAHGNLGVTAGCNQQTAPYAVDGGTVRWTHPAAGTLMGCEPALQAQDQRLATLLTKGMAASESGRTLRLTQGDVVIELAEKPAQAPRPPVVGTAWTLLRAVEREGRAVEVPPGPGAPTLKFGAGHRVSVSTSCNEGGGEANVRQDGLIVFGPLALTRKACHGVPARLQAAITHVLHGTTAYSFVGDDDLVIANGGDHLVYASSARGR